METKKPLLRDFFVGSFKLIIPASEDRVNVYYIHNVRATTEQAVSLF